MHAKTPANFYFREKIPYKTILVAFLFLVLGTIFLILGGQELTEEVIDWTKATERLILGGILFIPGSYHSFLAFMVLRGAQGYDYQNLTVFENDDFHHND